MASSNNTGKHEIVKYSNDLAELPFTDFNPAELDIFMTLCAECKDKGTEPITLPFSRLKELSNYTHTNRIVRTEEEIQAESSNQLIAPQSFVGALKLTNKKLLQLNMELHSETSPGISVQFNLFKSFITDEVNNTLTVKVNEDFSYILSELTSEFTQFELAEFVALRSAYAKGAYRQMKRFKDTGLWYAPVEKFKRVLDVPSSYKAKDIETRIISPILGELSHIFEDLTCTKEYAMKTKRGRPSISAYKFTWKPQVSTKKGKTEDVPSEYRCPKCGEHLVEKTINNSTCWCHPANYYLNRKNGSNLCEALYNSIEEICRERDRLEDNVQETVSPEEMEKRRQNQRILNEMARRMFEKDEKPEIRYPVSIPEQIKAKIPNIQDYVIECTLDLQDNNTARYERDLRKLHNVLEENGFPAEYAEKYLL